MEEPILESCSFYFSQEPNCLSDNHEHLTIECNSSLGIDRDKDCFFILKTDGWSVDSIKDIDKLLKRIEKII